MKGIKNALTFLFGFVYASAIWQLIRFPIAADDHAVINGWSFGSIILLFVGGVLILISVIYYLVEHWDDEE
jgi:hypothetical protein